MQLLATVLLANVSYRLKHAAFVIPEGRSTASIRLQDTWCASIDNFCGEGSVAFD